ncbi:MAG TPA: LysM peptidoglycan-binding domain-containing protein [bacterium]
MVQRSYFYIAILIIVFFTPAFPIAAAENQDNFPVPEILKPNVDFWIKVYTLYSSEQIVIHDTENLNIIYQVVDSKDISDGNKNSSKKLREQAEKAKQFYRNILLKLSTSFPIDPALLSNEEKNVYNLFQPNASPQVFQRAAQNIRGQQGLRDHFKKGLIISGKYLDHIKEIFERYDVPKELIALPHVESSFNNRAYSKFGAAGIWQFTRSTGRRFLRIDYSIDERFDPYLSTEAAAKLLRENYEILGTWPLAITAYNHGVNGMKRAVAQLGTTDIGTIVQNYESRIFKFASSNFYAEFLAAIAVRKNYNIYFGELEFEKPEKHHVFQIPNTITLSNLANQFKVSVNDIQRLNPSLRSSVLSSNRSLPKGYTIRLPWREEFETTLASIEIPRVEQKQEQVATDWYKIEKGDNLQDIAKRFNTTVASIMDLNDIDNPHQIYAGQVLRLKPEEQKLAEVANTKLPDAVSDTKIKATNNIEPVPVIEKAITPTREQISPSKATPKADEKSEVITIDPDANLAAALVPSIEESQRRNVKPAYGYIYVQPEETLGHFADWLAVPTQELRDLNGFHFGQGLHLGQKVKMIYRELSEKQFHRKRAEYHRGIEEDFFASFKIEGVTLHKIKSGENIWYLCNQVYEIPYWLILKYNPNKNLERLTANDELIIPIVVRAENNIAG